MTTGDESGISAPSMYLPAQFASADVQHAIRVMREQVLASLISVDDGGVPFVSHLPLHVEQNGTELTLLGHLSRANKHVQWLRARPQALVTYVGSHGYLSPRFYPDRERVPSWNYLAVHCRVCVELIDDAVQADALLKTLIADHEPSYASQWRSLPETFTQGMLKGIVAFRAHVQQLEIKLKLNQHRPLSHAAMAAAYAHGTPGEQGLRAWMEVLGLVDATGAVPPAADV